MSNEKLIQQIAIALAACRSKHRRNMMNDGGLRALQSCPEPTDIENAQAAFEAYQLYADDVRAQFESECG